jgi:hypothetical protein
MNLMFVNLVLITNLKVTQIIQKKVGNDIHIFDQKSFKFNYNKFELLIMS